MKTRILIQLPLVFCLLVLTSGCWDNKDINKRYLPAVMGIDKGEKAKYKVVLQTPTSSGQTQILEKEANSLSKAIELIRTDAEKSIDLVHLRLFLISEKAAEKGIDNVINFAVRSNDISIKGMVAIVTGDFEKTLYHQIRPTPEVSSYDYFSEEAGWTPSVSIVRIWEAYRSSHSYSEDMAIPLLTAGEHTLFTFEGSAIMREDRMIGVLTPEETLLFNIFKGKYTGGMIEVAKNTSVVIKKAKVHHHASWTNKGPKLMSDIRLDVVVAESPPNFTDQEIKQVIQQKINKKFITMFDKLQRLNSDALGTGIILRPKMSQAEIQNWKSKWFPKLQQEANVQINVQSDIYFKEKTSSTSNK